MIPARALLPLCLAGACVTSVVDLEPPAEAVALEPVVIPLGGGASARARPVDQYFESVIAQMQEALRERDLTRLRGLLEGHQRSDAPQWARDRMEHFEVAALGLEFELHAAQHSRIEVLGGAGPIGAPLRFLFRLEGAKGRDVVLDRGGPTGLAFLATLLVVDHDPFGGRTERSASRILRLGEDEQGEGAANTATFRAEPEAGNAVLREVRVTVELLPGSVEIDGHEAPVQRTVVCERRDVLYPVGVEAIRDQPLRTLRTALALGDARRFPHLYLAARFLPEDQREEALAPLVQSVRLGNPAQARVAMACLAVLTREDIPVGDRAAWLAWWQQRAGSER